jgi:histidinol dehydrogenase
VVVADESAEPHWIAADLLSQAEHGEDSLAMLLTPSEALARAVTSEVERQLETLPRREIAAACLERRGWAIVTRDLEEACALADRCAPEHVELVVRDPDRWLPLIRNAGAIFVGGCAAEAVGDYIAGPSHVLPTGGTARFSSPLNVDDFLKKTSIVRYTPERLRRDAPHVAQLARAEGLEAHARAVEIRLTGG